MRNLTSLGLSFLTYRMKGITRSSLTASKVWSPDGPVGAGKGAERGVWAPLPVTSTRQMLRQSGWPTSPLQRPRAGDWGLWTSASCSVW